MIKQTDGMVSKDAVLSILRKADHLECSMSEYQNIIEAIEVMPCSDDKLVEITVVGERCVYINDTRVAGSKPYISENIPQHSFEVKASAIIKAIKDKSAR